MENKAKPKKELTIEQKINRRNFISFGVFGVMGAAAWKGWSWLYNAPKETASATAGARLPLRRALNKTELAFRNFFSNNHLVKTYPKEMAAKNVKVNSFIGLKSKFEIADWRLQVVKQSGEVLSFTIDQIKALPKTEIIYDFKCVEGWDQIQHWGGLKVIDFIEHFGLAEETKAAYVGMMTPDKVYQVGLDMPSALHPQTILAYEMNGQPIPINHGAPLRLIIPVKYGIKNIKRIGSITFSNTRPPDYWARAGYDYYSGL
ncbi:molybdopterin-dependent oxidoreductase [Mucilaginibacter pedocola]|uniref:Molybdopterin-binding oxidoreductase n=1 Tax=Mucilaginibacter pedocola TaxID=1792845 RepID=A0A1S9P9X9_9SPHI|nr:molybdopterin-dependent oxidoreductase [Mucilaginibacter pedocola]OOQ57637.1 molybdopterin-binding oxidoreductase [Mucilaginibacter pedocola]